MKDENTLEFLKRRFKKTMPMYWSFIVFWLILKIYRKGMPFHSILGNILGIENLTCSGNDFNWYISAIWMFYLLTPVFAKIIDKMNSFFKFVVLLIITLLISVSFTNSKILIITISRLPIYLIGMYCAKIWKEKETLSYKTIIYLIILSIIGYTTLNILNTKLSTEDMWNMAFYWYPFILITPGLCVTISLISKYVRKFKLGEYALKIMNIIGNNTFEIYLIHILLFGMYNVHNFCNKFTLIVLVIISTIIFKYYYKFIKIIYHKIVVLGKEKNIERLK